MCVDINATVNIYKEMPFAILREARRIFAPFVLNLPLAYYLTYLLTYSIIQKIRAQGRKIKTPLWSGSTCERYFSFLFDRRQTVPAVW